MGNGRVATVLRGKKRKREGMAGETVIGSGGVAGEGVGKRGGGLGTRGKKGGGGREKRRRKKMEEEGRCRWMDGDGVVWRLVRRNRRERGRQIEEEEVGGGGAIGMG